MEIRELSSRDELREQAFPVIRELRSHLTLESFMELTEQAVRHSNYRLVGVFEADRCVAAMGFRLLHDFVHGKHLYIDDLVVTEACRGRGVGALLLRFAEKEAASAQCTGLRLCTGVENDNGKKFYLREGWLERAVVFKKQISGL